MEKLYILNEIVGTEKRIISASQDIAVVLKFMREHEYLMAPDNDGNGWEILQLKYDELGNVKTSLIIAEIKKCDNTGIKLLKGKVYNILVGMHFDGISDVMYLSNMKCIDVSKNGYTLEGVPGTVGSLQKPVFVYKDEVFGLYDKDLFDCVIHT